MNWQLRVAAGLVFLTLFFIILSGSYCADTDEEVLQRKLRTIADAIEAVKKSNSAQSTKWQTELSEFERRQRGLYRVRNKNPELHMCVKYGLGWHRCDPSVRVNIIGGPIVLGLAGLAPWNVQLGAGVKLTKVVVFGEGAVNGLPADIPVVREKSISVNQKTPTDAELALVVEKTVKLPLATCQRSFSACELGPENPAWRSQHIQFSMRDLYTRCNEYLLSAGNNSVKSIRYQAICFDAPSSPASIPSGKTPGTYHYNYARYLAECDAFGVVRKDVSLAPGEEVAVASSKERTYYAVHPDKKYPYGSNIVEVVNGNPKVLAVPENIPEPGPNALLAYDSRRSSLFVLTHDFLYRYMPATESWSVITSSLAWLQKLYVNGGTSGDRDCPECYFRALCYSAEDDSLYVLTGQNHFSGPVEAEDLMKVTHEGFVAFTQKLSEPVRGGRPQAGVSGSHLVVLSPPGDEFDGVTIRRVHGTTNVFDKNTGTKCYEIPFPSSSKASQ